MDQPTVQMTSTDIDPEDSNIGHLYVNGFTISLGTGDVTVTLLLNNKPVQYLQMSYTLAKTLTASLGQTVSALEEITGNEIMTTHYIAERMQAASEGHSDD